MTSNASSSLPEFITQAGAEMLKRVRRSLVHVRNEPRGAGAGLLWRQDGIVITNYHVIAGEWPPRSEAALLSYGQNLSVVLQDGRSYPARVLARHPEVDLAILKIDAAALPVAMIADSRSLNVGQLVFAFGHPWGLPYVVTGGIVSALTTVQTRSGKEFPIIRSDALLAPGNSGGPLVNAAGGVIGINTMIVGGDQGVAIPSHLAQRFVEESC